MTPLKFIVKAFKLAFLVFEFPFPSIFSKQPWPVEFNFQGVQSVANLFEGVAEWASWSANKKLSLKFNQEV